MDDLTQLVVFTLNEQRYALYLSSVERVIRAVEITSLPKAPEIVMGVINIQGKVIPVVNVRKRFHLAEKEIELNDQFIIAHTSSRALAFVVDAVVSVLDYSEQAIIEAKSIVPGLEYVEGVAKLEDGLILIHNLDSFLSLEEDKALESVLRKT